MAGPNLRYPFKNIDKSDDYLKIDILEYVPPGINVSLESFAQRSSDEVGYGTKEMRGSIILPIPEGISDANLASWSSGSLGPMETAGLGVALGTIQSDSFIGGLIESGKKAGTLAANASKVGTTQKMVQQFFAVEGVKQLLGSREDLFRSSLSRSTGAVFNENVELLFNGVALRPEFTFQFDMVPRSKRESDEIKEIIRLLKTEMAAKKGFEKGDASGLFLKSPSVFRLQYMSGGQPHPYLNKFKICALTGMIVNYTGSGTYATYADATPVHMQMGLNFQELTPIYREDYFEEDGVTFKHSGTGY